MMKTLMIACFAALLGIRSSYAQTADADKEHENVAAILHVIGDFASGIDTQDAGLAGNVMHESTAHHYMTPNGFMTVTQAQFLGMLREKKVGGEARSLDIESISLSGPGASVKVVQDNGRATFTYFLSLMTFEEGWKIVSVSAILSPGTP